MRERWSTKKTYAEEARRWLIQAQDEFQDADELRLRDRFYLALFHFQLAAEKALKAYLLATLESTEILRTHSIDDLVGTAGRADPEFKAVAAAKKLDQYYVPTRYPNGLPGGIPSRHYDDPEQAAEAMRLARGVLELVERKVRLTPPLPGPTAGCGRL